MAEGYDDLLATAESRPGGRRPADAGRGAAAPSTCRGWSAPGVRAFHLDEQTRPGGSRKAYVDAALTRSWRLLLDDADGRI